MKCSFILLPEGNLNFGDISAVISDVGLRSGVQRMDVHFHPSIDLSNLFTSDQKNLTASFLAIRAEANHPGPTAFAYHLSRTLEMEALAIESNDFYQAGGFQLWDPTGERETGVHVDGQMNESSLAINCMEAPLRGLEIFFKTSLVPKDEKKIRLFLLEEIARLAQKKPGVDHRILENGQRQDSTYVLSSAGIDWDWHTGMLDWPMLKYPAILKLNARKQR